MLKCLDALMVHAESSPNQMFNYYSLPALPHGFPRTDGHEEKPARQQQQQEETDKDAEGDELGFEDAADGTRKRKRKTFGGKGLKKARGAAEDKHPLSLLAASSALARSDIVLETTVNVLLQAGLRLHGLHSKVVRRMLDLFIAICSGPGAVCSMLHQSMIYRCLQKSHDRHPRMAKGIVAGYVFILPRRSP